MEIKQINKDRLAALIQKKMKVKVNTNSLFDIQVKRIHEYKRQFMNILYVIDRYLYLKSCTKLQRSKIVPRTVIIGGKAAPGYYTAKKIIKLISEVGNVVNNDDDVGDLLKVLFFPNYNVSNAEIIIPASDISEHISTAGTEASGTSNMKFCMNGGILIGTLDGANIEIREEVGKENIYIFGKRVHEIAEETEKVTTYFLNSPLKMYHADYNEYFCDDLKIIFSEIRKGRFGNPEEFGELLNTITNHNDKYLIGVDYMDYKKCQEQVYFI